MPTAAEQLAVARRGGPGGRRWPSRGRSTATAPRTLRLAVIGMGKTGGGELNYVSRRRRHLRRRTRRGGRRGSRARRRHRPGHGHDAGLLGQHRRGHAVAGRRRAAPRGQVRTAGPDHRQPPDLLRALGEDLGVPGPAQGVGVGRRPGGREGLQGRDPAAGLGRRGPRPLRRGRPGDAPARRAARPGRRGRPPAQARAAAACATSSSPSSCCSWCTGGATRHCASATTLEASLGAREGRLHRPRGRR